MTDIDQGLAQGWIETRSGIQFDYNHTTEDMIDITDIASALSKLNRYNGHTNRAYSVAHHSILMADWLFKNHYPPIAALQALLHDATEAYIGDMVRPLKPMFPEFKALENRLWGLIATKFEVPVEMFDVVKELDTRILVDERAEFMTSSGHDWGLDGISPLGVTFEGWFSPADVEDFFLNDFDKYTSIIRDQK